ncbi:MAG: MOSC domain-containing protein [Gemmatimonadota bacterium]
MSIQQTDSLAERGVVRAVMAGPIRTMRSPREPDGVATTWRSAILKSLVPRAEVHSLGLVGDAQKEKKHHGGPMKAVLVYGASHYTMWDAVLRPHAEAFAETLRGMSDDVDASVYGFGAFGENLTVDGLDEGRVCLGDRWRFGSCELQITEPRGPCGTLTRRWLRPALLREVSQTAAAGWYNAVLRDGVVAHGDEVVLLERVQDQWTMKRVLHLIEQRVVSRADVQALHDAPFVHDELRVRLRRRLDTPGRTRD